MLGKEAAMLDDRRGSKGGANSLVESRVEQVPKRSAGDGQHSRAWTEEVARPHLKRNGKTM